jgi:hypothetical protein
MKRERQEDTDESAALNQPAEKKRADTADEALASEAKQPELEQKAASKPAVDVGIALEKLSKFLANPKKIDKAVELTIKLAKVN